MRCPTIQVNIKGQKVIINVADFDADTMTVWVDYNPEAVVQAEKSHVLGGSSEVLSPMIHDSRLVPPPPLMKNFNATK